MIILNQHVRMIPGTLCLQSDRVGGLIIEEDGYSRCIVVGGVLLLGKVTVSVCSFVLECVHPRFVYPTTA